MVALMSHQRDHWLVGMVGQQQQYIYILLLTNHPFNQ
jgi:hypothetical protein